MSRPLSTITFAILAVVGLTSCGCTSPHGRPADEFRVGIEGTPDTLDPRYASDAHGARILPLLFNGLLAPLPSGEFRLDLAEAWNRPDLLTHIFRLRRGVRFHDGTVLTARDVAATFRYLGDLSHGCPAGGALKDVESVVALDGETVRFRLRRPSVSLPFQLTAGILPERLAERREIAEGLVGTGPYRLESFRSGSEIVLRAFDGYFRGRPPLGTLRFRILSNATTRLLEIRSGGIDLLENAVPPYAVKFLQRDPDIQVITGPGSSYQYLGFNFEDPILSDVRVRRALALAIDRKQLIDSALEGFARPATGLLPPEHWAFSGSVPRWDFDPQRSKALLDQAGYADPDGDGPRERFRLSYKTSTDKTANEVAQIIADQLRRVGIGLDVRSYEWGTFFSDVKQGNFQLMSLRWVGLNDPDSFHFLFHSSSVPPSGANRGRYRNPTVDRWIEESRSETDEGRRKEIYGRIQEEIARDCAYASLWWLDNVVVLRKGFTGFRPLPGGEYTSLAEMRRSSPL